MVLGSGLSDILITHTGNIRCPCDADVTNILIINNADLTIAEFGNKILPQ